MSAPALLLVVAFAVPVGFIVYYSFRTDILSVGPSTFTLHAYRRFFADAALPRLLFFSTGFAFLVAVTSVALAYPAAFYLAFRARRHRMLQLALMVVPSMTSYLLRVLAIRILLGASASLLTPLKWIHLIHGQPELLYTRQAVFITLVLVWIPFATLPLFASLSRVNPNLFESSSDLGARGWQTFLFVTLPESVPGLLAAMAYVFIPTLGEWVTPALVGGTKGLLYGNSVEDAFSESMAWNLGAAMTNMILLLMVVLAGIAGAIYLLRRRSANRNVVREATE